MFSRNAKYYEWLPAYLENGLDPARQAQMMAHLAADPALAAEAERLRPLIHALKAAKLREEAPQGNGVVPEDLWRRLQQRMETPQRGVPAARRARQFGWAGGIGAAAALAVIVALRLPQSVPVAPPQSVPVASPVHSGGASKSDKTNPLPTAHALSKPVPGTKPVTSSTLAAHPAPNTKVVAPPQTITFTYGGNDPFAAPPAPKLPTTYHAQSLSVPAPPSTTNLSPITGGKVAPAEVKPEHRTARAVGGSAMMDRNGGANSINSINGTDTLSSGVNGNAPSPTGPQAPAANLAPTPAAVPPAAPAFAQANAAAPASLPRSDNQVPHLGGLSPMSGVGKAALPQTRMRVFRKMQVVPRDIDGAVPPALETEQASLSAAVQAPLWGGDAGAEQANRALMAVREAGLLDSLRAKLEARREQSPQDVGTGRMLAAVYEFGFESDSTLHERRRVAGLSGAGGEDWFALAQAERAAGNSQAARAAYRHALDSAVPLNSFHAALARQRG